MDPRRAYRTTLRPLIGRSVAFAGVAMALLSAPAAAQAPLSVVADVGGAAPNFRDSLVILARAQIGARYRTGGDTPSSGFDCSGLVQYLMAQLQMPLPRTARDQAALGVVVERDTSQLRPGDLLTFSSRARGPVTHVGVYVGGGRFIHASSVGRRVMEVPLDRPPAPRIKLWTGARRIPWALDEGPAELLPTPER